MSEIPKFTIPVQIISEDDHGWLVFRTLETGIQWLARRAEQVDLSTAEGLPIIPIIGESTRSLSARIQGPLIRQLDKLGGKPNASVILVDLMR